ncbi:MAG: ribbon-helix-helix domain-containing protein [Methanosarcinales archaeon]|nr:MAG: winged helix-turn-helix domain-containing protein [Methanosarcinales archaeon]
MQVVGTHKTTQIPPVRVEKHVLEELDKIVKTRGYRSRTELIREAIEEKIAQLKGTPMTELREITNKEAKQEILNYIKGKPQVYPSEVAEALRLPLEQAFEVVNELFAEDKVEEA